MMRSRLQHLFNELNLYCRFKDCGLPAQIAKRWSRKIGGWLRPLIYGKGN